METDGDRLNKVIRELNGKDIGDVTAQGVGQLASRPAGRAAADSAAPGAAAPAAGSVPPPPLQQRSQESDDDDVGFGLFD
ncbi:hypothetical protein U0070_002845 [Myodes glareolus]|uniref:Large ribosomal subunit protein P2 n=1 Tax=Myodes glareolus TaxID=447135 RepID=A0AAW0I8F3_MYOGA